MATWKEEGWVKPELIEDTALNQVTFYLKMILEHGEQSAKKASEKSAESSEIAEKIGLKGPRTRQLLSELVAMGRLTCTAAIKNRRYIMIE